MRVCRKEIEQYVATNTILLEENKLLKEIEKTKEYIKEKEISDNDVIEFEDCSDDEEDNNADIDDTEAAATFLRNKKNRTLQEPDKKFICHKIKTPKNTVKCGKCLFEVKDKSQLKGHTTKHEEGNVNYVQMFKCDVCDILIKTVGLLRRHMAGMLQEEHPFIKMYKIS